LVGDFVCVALFFLIELDSLFFDGFAWHGCASISLLPSTMVGDL
jgi:hypothetical protein